VAATKAAVTRMILKGDSTQRKKGDVQIQQEIDDVKILWELEIVELKQIVRELLKYLYNSRYAVIQRYRTD
jgi:hypothetical protein